MGSDHLYMPNNPRPGDVISTDIGNIVPNFSAAASGTSNAKDPPLLDLKSQGP
jgi:hypothetical protein